MHALFQILSIVAALAGLFCWIVILIDAFQDAIWKGLVGLFIWIYLLYYGIFEFEHDNKLLILLGAFGGSAVAAALSRMG
jgi:hypothetical protein